MTTKRIAAQNNAAPLSETFIIGPVHLLLHIPGISLARGIVIDFPLNNGAFVVTHCPAVLFQLCPQNTPPRYVEPKISETRRTGHNQLRKTRSFILGGTTLSSQLFDKGFNLKICIV
jgi:hypothetical protein